MKVALVGFQGCGKTAVFNALTGQKAETGLGKKAANLGRIQVPDARVDELSRVYRPKKTTHAEIQFVDVAGPQDTGARSTSGLDAATVNAIREADALVHVVRAFVNPQLDRPPNPTRDLVAFLDEIALTDLVQVEARVTRLKKQPRTKELDLFERLMADLEGGKAIRDIALHDDERQMIAGFRFLSQKPMLVLVNVVESDVRAPLSPELVAAAQARGLEILAMSALVEAEIMSMEPKDQAAFLEDLGLCEAARGRFIQAAYRLLDLISFLTTGDDEVRAWTIRRGTHARAAAGKIHSDIERGFIRAEVTPYGEWIAAGKSESRVKELGKMRLEGKDYVVLDGDIVHFRHSG